MGTAPIAVHNGKSTHSGNPQHYAAITSFVGTVVWPHCECVYQLECIWCENDPWFSEFFWSDWRLCWRYNGLILKVSLHNLQALFWCSFCSEVAKRQIGTQWKQCCQFKNLSKLLITLINFDNCITKFWNQYGYVNDIIDWDYLLKNISFYIGKWNIFINKLLFTLWYLKGIL